MFEVVAVSATPVTYQWFFNGYPIPGQTASNLVINSVQTRDDGFYSVRVTNADNDIYSNAVRLNVLAPPAFVIQPLSQSVVEGGTVTFSVQTEGVLPMGYRWRRKQPKPV